MYSNKIVQLKVKLYIFFTNYMVLNLISTVFDFTSADQLIKYTMIQRIISSWFILLIMQIIFNFCSYIEYTYIIEALFMIKTVHHCRFQIMFHKNVSLKDYLNLCIISEPNLMYRLLLRWHGRHSVEVTENINLGYSRNQGYS